MAKPHILFHRPTPWESELQCSTKTYAQLFSDAGYAVTYLQANINLAHKALKKGYYHTYKLGSRFEGKIWVTGALSLVPHLDNKGKLLAKLSAGNSYKTAVPSVKKLVEKSGYGPPQIIWTTVPGSSALKDIFPQAALFFHVVDRYSAYRGSGINALEAKDYQRADHLFVIGEALNRYLQNDFHISSGKITNLGQGVHLSQYQKNYPTPAPLKNLRGPIAIWIGLTRKLDQPMLHVLAQEMQAQKGQVVLIGPACDGLQDLIAQHKNLHFLGPVASQEVPHYLKAAHLGIMIYDRNKQEIYRGQHPLKLYEYAAAGLPVLSTPHQEFETLAPPVVEVQTEADLKKGLSELIENYAHYQQAMLAFAQQHSWQSCMAAAEEVFKRKQLL
jgi:glycosyltransferase involved in cell wall biosynthesis